MTQIRVCIYARYSSDNQRDESIDAQIRACEAYAKSRNYLVVHAYTDRAKSAMSDRRPSFQEMIADSGKGLFSTVLVHKLDRFSRDKFDSARYKHTLKLNGVRVESVLERLDDSPESVILESMLEGMAEYYSRNLARETMKGMVENALKCRHTGGVPPLGYDVDPDTRLLVINEDEADTVRRVFDMYLSGKGYGQIIGALNALGRRTRRQAAFGKNSLHDLLVNEKYCGVYIFNASPSKDARRKRNNHGRKSDEDVIRIEGGVPAIVTREVWEAAQTRMAQNRRTPGTYKAKDVYLLSGLIFCGECAQDGIEYAMAGNPHLGGRNKTRYVSYRCGNRDRKLAACPNTELRREYIESFVLRELRRRVFNEANIPSLTRRLNEHLKKSDERRQRDLRQAQSDRAKIERQIANIIAVVSNGNAYPTLLEQLSDLEERKAALEATIAELDAKAPELTVTEEQLRALFDIFERSVALKNIPELKRFVQSYVRKVVVYRDRVEVAFAIGVPGSGPGMAPLELGSTETRKTLEKGSGDVA